MADSIERAIARNGEPEEYGYSQTYSDEVIEKLEEAAHTLRQAGDMAQRVDWLLSGDDGEESMLRRWKEEVRPYYKTISEHD
jgi:hypothetical protein